MSSDIPKVAIIGPSFFSYMNAICDEFKKSRGIQADFFDERHSNSVISKILYRLNISWVIKGKKQLHLINILNVLIRNEYTDVMLIDVEVVDKNFVESLKQNGINVHIYMWDSAKNKGRFVSYLDDVSGKGSFDPNDCKTYNMLYIPLFAQDIYSQNSTKEMQRNIDISFCGTLHSDRANHLYKLKKMANKRKLNIVLLTYFHSKLLLVIKSLVNISNVHFLSTISTTGFSRQEVADSMFRSKFIFDIQHKGQSGLTARTFEAIRSGASLITFNKNVHSLPKHYHNRIFLIEDVTDIDGIDFSVCGKLDDLTDDQDYYLSISRFIDNLIEIMGYSDIPKINAIEKKGIL